LWKVVPYGLTESAATSRTSSLAGAIAGVIRQDGYAEAQAIGAGAVNQAIKALVLANSYLKEEGIRIAFRPEFVDVGIEERVVSGIKSVAQPIPSVANQSDHFEPDRND
jgi:stage V sporulation protein S